MITAPAMHPLCDVQNSRDDRDFAIDRVGVSELRYPIQVLDRKESSQQTTATITMSVSLPHHFKGTHMSRFIEVLNEHRGEFTMHTLPAILKALTSRLDAETARIELAFSYFMERTAPVSGARALMDYECMLVGETDRGNNDFVLSVRIPVTSLCPCSKAISDYGAHNQRGHVTVEVRSANVAGRPALIWIEELVEIAEQSASSPVYPLLKRPDERYVTMRAYDNPVFVEDLVRNVAVKLKKDDRVDWFKVRVVNQESIHNHNAFAQIEWKRSAAATIPS